MHEKDTVNIEVSSAAAHQLDRQIRDAVSFLGRHIADIQHLCNYPGIELVTLDFAIESRDCVLQSEILPAELISLAGELGLAIEITLYPPLDDDEYDSTPWLDPATG